MYASKEKKSNERGQKEQNSSGARWRTIFPKAHMFSPFATSPLATVSVAAGTLGPGTPPGAFRGGPEETPEEDAPLGSTGNVDDEERLLLANVIVTRSRPTGPWNRSTDRSRGSGRRRRRL